MAVKMAKSDADWQAESDAHTLADAEEIRRNKARAKRAINKAEELARKAEANVKAARKSVKSPRGAKKGGRKK